DHEVALRRPLLESDGCFRFPVLDGFGHPDLVGEAGIDLEHDGLVGPAGTRARNADAELFEAAAQDDGCFEDREPVDRGVFELLLDTGLGQKSDPANGWTR